MNYAGGYLRAGIRRLSRVFICAGFLLLMAEVMMWGRVAAATETGIETRDEALAHLYSANALYNRRLFELSAEEYRAFIENYSNHPRVEEARFGLALSDYALGRMEQAATLFGELRSSGGSVEEQRAQIHTLHGFALLSMNRNQDAAGSFQWTIEHGESVAQRAEALAGLVEALYRLERWEELIRSAKPLAVETAGTHHAPRIGFQIAAAHFELERYEDAAAVLADLLQDYPETLFAQQANFFLAECKRQTGDLDGAATHYASARDISGNFSDEAQYRLAFVRFMQERYEDALREFGRYLDAHADGPNRAPTHLYLGRALLETGAFDEAREHLSAMTGDESVGAEATLWLGRLHARQGNDEDTERLLASAVPRFEDHRLQADIYFELGQARLRRERFAEAAEAFDAARQISSDTELIAEALWLEAYSLHRASLYEQSRVACRAYITQHPDGQRLADALYLTAENYFFEDDFAAASAVYGDYISAHSDNAQVPSARLRRAQALYFSGEWQETLKHLQPLVEDRPDAPEFAAVAYLAGDAHYRLEQWEQAADAFKQYTDEYQQSDNTDSALLKLALARQRLGENDAAITVLERLIRNHTDSQHRPRAGIELGRLLYETGRYVQAREVLAAVPDLEQHPRALYYLGWVALAEGSPVDAGRRFAELTERHSQSPLAVDAAIQQAILRLHGGEPDKARSILSTLHERHPGHEQADQILFFLALSLARQEKLEEAGQHFDLMLRLFEHSPLRDRALYERAWCARRLEQHDIATEHFRVLLAEHPDSPLAGEGTYALAELELDAGDTEAGLARLVKLVELTGDGELQARAAFLLGRGTFGTGDMRAAALAFETVKLPENATSEQQYRKAAAAFHAGEARLALREYATARDRFGQSAAMSEDMPVHARALLRLAEAQALMNEWRNSESTARDFLRHHAGHDLAHRALFALGWALENQQRYDDAVAAYREVLAANRRDETSARAQFQIGECLFARREYNAAVRELIRVEVQHAWPEWSSKALLEIGRILEAQERPEEAAERYREVSEKYPDSDAATVARRQLAEIDR